MASYHISFKKWSNPRREDLAGYNAWDYLSGTPGTFATRSEAADWLRRHRKGKDRYGVNALFRVVKGQANPSKRKTRKRVSSALKKYIRKVTPNPGKSVVRVKEGQSLEAGERRAQKMADRLGRPVEIHYQRVSSEGKTYGTHNLYWAYLDTKYPKQKNPAGRKVKGGRAVSLRNFTGSVVRMSNGQVVIRGKGKR